MAHQQQPSKCFQVIFILGKLLSPTPPPPHAHLRRPKLAIIGAGLTGVSAASHCVGHGFDCTIFEAGDREHLGGIWSVSTNYGASMLITTSALFIYDVIDILLLCLRA